MSARSLPPLLLALSFWGSAAGCATSSALLLPQRGPVPSEPAVAAAVTRFDEGRERLLAHAAFYEHEVRKNHTKMRLMGVFSILGAGGAAGATASAFHPLLPADARPAITTVSVSLSVLSGVFVLLPHAHQYILKEAGYRAQAHRVRDALSALHARCGPGALRGPDRPIEALDACVHDVDLALAEARRFTEDSPCNPPPEAELRKLLLGASRPAAP